MPRSRVSTVTAHRSANIASPSRDSPRLSALLWIRYNARGCALNLPALEPAWGP